MRKNIGYFNTFIDYIKHFKDHFYLVTPLNEEAHVKISHLEPVIHPYARTYFVSIWTKVITWRRWDHISIRREACLRRSYTWRPNWWPFVRSLDILVDISLLRGRQKKAEKGASWPDGWWTPNQRRKGREYSESFLKALFSLFHFLDSSLTSPLLIV